MAEATEILKKVRKIEIKTRGISNDIFSGEYHSAFKGRGMSFSEVRPYQYGDDIRNIDWNVTARYNEPFIKVFEEERELTVFLLVDVSASGKFGTRNMFKSDYTLELCAVLAFSAISNNDKVGMILFSEKMEKFIKPGKGKTHILRIIRELIYFTPQYKKTDIKLAAEYLVHAVKRKSTVFLISDFIDEGYADALKLASKKHDLVGIKIYDAMEKKIPDAGILKIRDAESGEEIWVDTSDKKSRRVYEQIQQQKEDYFQRTFSRNGIDFISMNTEQSYISELRKFFLKRGKKR